MKQKQIFEELSRNIKVFKSLFLNLSKEEYLWKSNQDHWCLLEILCHLYDEEREDFMARTKHVLENPHLKLPLFDQIAWVKERNYIGQNFELMVQKFIEERQQSLIWLKSLKDPNWNNTFEHPKLGPMSAYYFLSNWLAHDYLHIKQITKLKFDFLAHSSKQDLSYAGKW
jgi:hypothetical protein